MPVLLANLVCRYISWQSPASQFVPALYGTEHDWAVSYCTYLRGERLCLMHRISAVKVPKCGRKRTFRISRISTEGGQKCISVGRPVTESSSVGRVEQPMVISLESLVVSWTSLAKSRTDSLSHANLSSTAGLSLSTTMNSSKGRC